MNPHFEIKDPALIDAVLDRAEYGTLALTDGGTPYAVPVNFVQISHDLYFHGALKNRKMSLIEAHPNVSFSVVEHYAIIDSNFSSDEGLACPATQFFKSVSIEGIATRIEDRDEKAAVLEVLMHKLQPKGGHAPLSDTAYDKALRATAVVKIEVTHRSCKFKFGQHLSEERFERIIAHLHERGTPLDLETITIMQNQRKPS